MKGKGGVRRAVKAEEPFGDGSEARPLISAKPVGGGEGVNYEKIRCWGMRRKFF